VTAESQGGNNRLNVPARDPWLRRMMQRSGGAGKGDQRRPVDKKKFDAEFDRIFGTRPDTIKVWDPNDPDHPKNRKEANESRSSDR
jgi:hypothetical protein